MRFYRKEFTAMPDLPPLPAGYDRIEHFSSALLVALAPCRAELQEFFARPIDAWREHPEARAYSGKGRHFSVPLPGKIGRGFVRVWSRGGGMAWLGRWYAAPGRPLEELRALVGARAAGVDVPEPLAVLIERSGLGYRFVSVFREVESSGTVPEVLGAFAGPSPLARARLRRKLAVRLGDAVGRLHAAGIYLRDLHLKNVLVTDAAQGRLAVVDLDPVERPAAGVDVRSLREATLGRLARSCRRWIYAGLVIGRSDAARFAKAYAQSTGLDRVERRRLARAVEWGETTEAGPRRDARGVSVHISVKGDAPEMIRPDRPTGILFQMPKWLGDAVMAMPLLEGVRRIWPKTRIGVLTPAKLKELYSLAPVDVDVFAYDGENKDAMLREIRSRRYTIGVAVPRSLGAARMAARCGAEIEVGYDGPLRWLFYWVRVHRRGVRSDRHRVDEFWSLGAPFRFDPFPPAPRLVVPEPARADAARLLAEAGVVGDEPLVGINPGAAYGPAKQWPIDRFIEAARKLDGGPRSRLLLFGSAAEAPLARAVADAVGPRAVVLAGRTSLSQLAALIARCRAFLTNDTGPMHVAAALGIPVVAVFGSTDPFATGPYGDRHRVVQAPVPCAPCLLRTCPIDFRCMTGIAVDRVVHAVERAVAG